MKLLLLEDDARVAPMLRLRLERAGHKVVLASTLQEAWECYLSTSLDAALLDVRLPDGNGLDLLRRIRKQDSDFPALVITGALSVDLAVEAMKAGAVDFIGKPLDAARLEVALGNVERLSKLNEEVRLLRESVTPRERLGDLVGSAPRMQTLYHIIRNVARSNATVMISGESGTGKELAARAIHAHSPRKDAPLVGVNCAALSSTLLESELFGHEKGAFTGATARHVGCFERAHGGTLFLDEICEMDLGLQAKLLRVLQEQEFHRVGGEDIVRVNVRVLCATNKDPLARIQAGRFREDLFYRLNVIPLEMPQLRQRREDIPLLAQYFLDEFSAANGKRFQTLHPDAIDALCAYDWPGNVRELRNLIERICVLHDEDIVGLTMIPAEIQSGQRPRPQTPNPADPTPQPSPFGQPNSPNANRLRPMWEIERDEIARALQLCNGNVKEVSQHLELSPATLYRKILKYDLKR